MKSVNERVESQVTSLNGTWDFLLDPEGKVEGSNTNIQDSTPIHVPGSWEEQGYGEPSDHYPIGTWKKEREYIGVAWYSKLIDIPETYQDHHIYMNVKGVRWLTEVWIDGKYAGNGDSLATPHRFNVTQFVTAGSSHKIAIKVDNRMNYDLGESHIHSYHTGTTWGGITGGIELEAFKPYSFKEVTIIPKPTTKQVEVDLVLNSDPIEAEWSVAATIYDVNQNVVTEQESILHNNQGKLTIDLGEKAETWSPSQPTLYQLEINLKKDSVDYDLISKSFGLRSVDVAKNQILINEKPVFLTGYVDCCIFPQTGYPSWDVEHYKHQFQTVKSYGFNHVRLHGWTPPEPFWQAADEEGMLVQTELPHWSTHYISRETNAPKDAHQFLAKELGRILSELQAHPSFIMLSLGNELISEEGHEQLNELVRVGKELDATRIYTDNTGFGELPGNDREGDFYIPTLNWHPPYHIDHAAGPDTTADFREVTRLDEKPLIAHEHGQFTMYVRPEEAAKYKGVIQPHWLHTINETLETKGLTNRVDEFIEATGTHLARTLKEALEKARRTPNLSGIQLLDIRDFPGQGHATVGILDVFWEAKGVIKPEEFRQFNDESVLLMRSTKRTFYAGEILEAKLEVSHFGTEEDMGELRWKLSSEGETLDQGVHARQKITRGQLNSLIHIESVLDSDIAKEVLLEVELELQESTIRNQWTFWVFPRADFPDSLSRVWSNAPALRSQLYGATFGEKIGTNQHTFYKVEGVDLAITDGLSRDILQYALDGGSVWLLAQPNQQQDEVMTRYLPIFWNYLWFPGQAGTTMGMLFHDHPALKGFPNDGTLDWHCYHLVDRAMSISLEQWPQVDPIIEVIDNFNRGKRLAHVFEVRVGRGKLFVSTLPFADKKLMKLPEVNDLFHRFLRYVRSDQFDPKTSLSIGELLSMFKLKAH